MMSPATFFTDYAAKPERLLIGLMSGTSVDGVDAALVRLSGSGRDTQLELLRALTYPMSLALREQVLELSHGGGSAEMVSQLSFALAEVFAEAALALKAGPVDAVASHGQTISHTPGFPATLQIGCPAVLAQRLQSVVVSDFRTADVAVGGQGAPLVPYADWCLLTHPTKARAIQNIGGIGNVTFLPADAKPEAVVGFDTGPGNMLIDRAAQWATNGMLRFDRDGALAFSGEPDRALLTKLLEHPFLHQSPPKSAGREEFGEALWRTLSRTENLVATLTWFTAHSIVEAYCQFLPQMPDEVIVGGGGAHNAALMTFLRQALSPIPVLTHEEVGMDSDAKEAVAFCVLANETLLGNPANLPSVTGARRAVTLGSVTLP